MASQNLKEGGNIFQGTADFDHTMIPAMMKQVNSVMAKTGVKALPIGSGATPTPGKVSGDLDMIADAGQIRDYFGVKDNKDAKIELEKLFQQAGLDTAKTGTSVHVKVPVGNEAHQVDIMVVPNAEHSSQFHVHNIPQGSPYKGVHKQIALAYLAKQKGLLWSPYSGLFSRLPNGKKDPNGFVTHDTDGVAKELLGSNATFRDLGSLESIMKVMDPAAAQQMLADLKATNPDKFTESAELTRIKQLSGLTLNSVRLL